MSDTNPFSAPDSDLSGPPPIPPSDPQPWNYYLTMIFGVVIFLLWTMVQSFAAIGLYLLAQEDPIAATENLEGSEVMKFASDGDVLSLITLISGAVSILVVWGIIRLRRMSFAQYLDFKKVNPLWIVLGIGLTLGLNYVLNFLSPYFKEEEINDFMEATYTSADNMALIWLGVALMAPFFEEIFFRGFLYTGWRVSYLGKFGAALMTSGIWAIIHMQYSSFIIGWIFFFGLALCLAREVTGSLWVPIAMHIFNNAWATYWTGSALAEGL